MSDAAKSLLSPLTGLFDPPQGYIIVSCNLLESTPDSLQSRSGFPGTTKQLENVTGASCSHNDSEGY
nr:hypothetical protein [Tanacetum cinerariifolium]